MAILQSQLKLSLIDGVTAKMRGISAAIKDLQATNCGVMARVQMLVLVNLFRQCENLEITYGMSVQEGSDV